MRICLVSYEFLPETGGGGAGALYTDLAKALSEKGHDVTVVSGNSIGNIETEAGGSLRVIRSGLMEALPVGSYGQLLLRSLQVAGLVKSEMSKTGKFDVIESPEFRGETYFSSLVNGRELPFVTRLVTPHFMVSETNKKRTDPIVNELEKRNARLSRLVLTDCEQWGKEIIHKWSISNEKLAVCPIGIDLTRVDSAKDLPIPIQSPYVLYSGKLTLAKGPVVLAKATPEIIDSHPDVKIVFVGADSYDLNGNSIRDLIRTSMPKGYLKSLVFLGHITSWDMLVSIYRNASVCVKADARGNHSFDALGQMACSKPLVCSKTEGYLDMIVEGWNGFLFDRNRPSELSEMVSTLLQDTQLAIDMGRRARETIETRFTAAYSASTTSEIYERALTGS